jgi:uncharacterized RDD family membrane protein YckC
VENLENKEGSAHIQKISTPESIPPVDEADDSLSRAETRAIVTPYAFTVSPRLLGQPLATPTRRAIAILIDIFLIGVLTSLSALFLAGFIALTFFKAGNRLKQQKRYNFMRLTLRGSAAFLIFVIVFVITDDMDKYSKTELSQEAQAQQNKDNMTGLVTITAKLAQMNCEEDSDCLVQYAAGVAVAANALDVPAQEIRTTTTAIVNEKQWTDENKSLFMDKFNTALNELRNDDSDKIEALAEVSQTPEQVSDVHSVLEWIKGVMADLGLSLGWAAMYFTVLTAWWQGQTLGKKLLGIEVVRLDGNYPTLWESFGRYGGYGAGFATGLLGFLQIYWDPNRQAIQDKISETLVLRLQANVQNK